jgi:hypothetical protein
MCFTVAGCSCPWRVGRGSVFVKGEADHYGDYDDLKRGDQFVEPGWAVVNRVVAPPGAAGAANPVVNPAVVHGVVWNTGLRNSFDPRRDARAQLDPKLDSGVLHRGGREGSRDVVPIHAVLRGREFTSPSELAAPNSLRRSF